MRLLGRGNLRAAWKTLRRNRIRSLLTMSGVIIGVASVISIVSIGEGVQQQVAKAVNHIGADLITVRAGQANAASNQGLDALTGLHINGTLTTKDAKTVQDVVKHGSVVPLTLIDGTVNFPGGSYASGHVLATNQDLPRMLNQGVAYGSFFSADDDGTNVAVLGQAAALKLFNTIVPLGQTFTFRGQTFSVHGIFDVFPSTPLANDVDFNNMIYIPNGTGAQLTHNTAGPYEILVKPATVSELDATVTDIRSSLAKSHGSSQDFSVLKTSDQLAQTSGTLSLLTELTAGMAAISLLVGGIGIMNITLVSVTERMHEVGIRKAVGATNRQILEEFMAEAVVLSVTGCVLGILAAGVIDVVLRVLTSLRPVIGWQVVILAAGVSIIIGILFGTAPALKAARKDPISALRNEW